MLHNLCRKLTSVKTLRDVFYELRYYKKSNMAFVDLPSSVIFFLFQVFGLSPGFPRKKNTQHEIESL